MYGNVESSRALGPDGREARSTPCPAEENLYEPLDPPGAEPSEKGAPDPPVTARASPAGHNRAARGPGVAHPPFPAAGCCPREKLVLVGAVALGVSLLANVLFLALGTRRVATLTEALEAEKAKEPPEEASRSFLLYNEAHRKCVEASGPWLTAAPCSPDSAAQRFQWLRGGRLRAWDGRRCVTALRGQNLSLVKLEACRADGPLQRWECRAGALLALAGHDLYFNYGNNRQQTVMLYAGDREWSRWVVHGSQDPVCSRSCCPPCSKGWTYFRNSCYFYSTTPSSWKSAQRFCSLLGSQLLEVDDPEEKAFIRTTLRSSSWLGIRDEEAEGTWRRANGTVLSRESSWWHRNEPNGGRQENCAAVREDGEWYDFPCSSQLPWLCEGHP